MAEDLVDRRKDYLKELAPWTKLFSAFKIALDPKKLVLAGGGILVMSLGWYVLSIIFFGANSKRPEWKDYQADANDSTTRVAAWKNFKTDRHRWYLLYEMAGVPTEDGKKQGEEDAADRADSLTDFEKIQNQPADPINKPYGRFRTLPWFEDRGPNPYLLVKGEATETIEANRGMASWFVRDQLPVLLEPLVKFFQPITYLFDPAAGFWNRVYLFLVILWSVATWAFFGGAITRIAAVQAARANERVGLTEAVKFVWARYVSYLTAPLWPLAVLAALTVVLLIFGFIESWGYAPGDVIMPILWPLVLLVGLIMALIVVGLVGWPLMYATISAEGSDSFDAISRSYSYVFQAPWQFLWYSFVALVYGAVLVFFVGLMGSLTVYMTKWGVTLVPTTDKREPSYLFQSAPTSFGWRDLLLNKSPNVERITEIGPRGNAQKVWKVKFTETYYNSPTNIWAAFWVSVWLYLMFLLIVGFGYSYFWTASTIIYLLMRQKVDDTDMDEIHLEEEPEPPFPAPATGGPAATEQAKANQSPLQMVEPPQLRPAAPPAAPPPAAPAQPPPVAPSGDGSSPMGGAP